jgi:hypothetical protein
MTGELLSGIAGVVLSLIFSYVPGIKDWFETLEPSIKQAVMGGLLVVVALAAFGLSCAGLDIGIVCSGAGAWELARLLLAALVANSSTYTATKHLKK